MPLWPLSIAGILLAALSGRIFFAVFAALILDIAWGAPTGLAQYLYFPVTLVALLSAALRLLSSRFLLQRGSPERV